MLRMIGNMRNVNCFCDKQSLHSHASLLYWLSGQWFLLDYTLIIRCNGFSC